VEDTGSRVGSTFGPYRLTRLLGRGGMGEVYEAEDTRKRRVVALKLISPQYSGNSVFRARMQREADTAGRLNEPHIVPIHDYGEIDGQFYLEMRLVDGVSLRSMLTRFGPLSPARAVATVRQIASALDAAHAIGVTHRDVKPENVLIAHNDFAYLMDFGIARAAADPGLTQSGAAVGTYHYMAPERFRSGNVTHHADIYALACVLSECLTAAPPYRADTVERLIGSHLLEPPPRPSQLRPGMVPQAFDQVVAKGMAKNPQDRYQSASDLAMAAHGALTANDQHQEARILQRGADATFPQGGAGGRNDRGVERTWTNYAGGAAAAQVPTGSEPGVSGREKTPPPDPPPATVGGGDSLPPPAGWPSNPDPPPTWVGPLAATASGGQKTEPPPTWVGPMPEAAGSAESPPPRPWMGPVPVAAGGGGPPPTQIAQIPQVPANPPKPQQKPNAEVAEEKPKSRNKRKLWAAVGAAALLLVAAVATTGYLWTRHSPSSPTQATGQTVLPFNGLNFRLSPGSVAVDGSGTVYVTNTSMRGKVVSLAAGSNTATVKPFNGLYEPQAVAVDGSGTVYVADFTNRVVKQAAGSNSETELPFDGLTFPEGLAVGAQGDVYVADRGKNRVLKLAAGAKAQTVLPFDGLKNPDGVAVDKDGNVYVTDTDNNRVLELPSGANGQVVVPFTSISVPWGIAVDSAGNIYVTEHDNNTVVEFAVGPKTQSVLPFTDLNTPLSVAVDKDGNVYVADRGNERVVKYTPPAR